MHDIERWYKEIRSDVGMKYELTTVRRNNVVSVLQVFMDGSRREIGRFLLVGDGQWRLDVTFMDDVIAAYKKRLRKAL